MTKDVYIEELLYQLKNYRTIEAILKAHHEWVVNLEYVTEHPTEYPWCAGAQHIKTGKQADFVGGKTLLEALELLSKKTGVAVSG